MRKYQLPITKEEVQSAIAALVEARRAQFKPSKDDPVPTYMTPSKLKRWFAARGMYEEADAIVNTGKTGPQHTHVMRYWFRKRAQQEE